MTASLSSSRVVAWRVAVVLACLIAVLVLSRENDWRPAWLVAGLIAAAIASDLLVVNITSDFSITAALVPIVLAAALSGPSPASAIGLVSSIVDGRRRGLRAHYWLGNAVSYGLIGLVIGLIARALHVPDHDGTTILLECGALYLIATFFSFGFASLTTRVSPRSSMSAVLLPFIPAEVLLTLTAAVGALLYRDREYGALASLGVVLLLFQYFAAGLLSARRRAQELGELAGRQTLLVAQISAAESIARAELAAALHSGPLQTLLSARQDLAERDVEHAAESVTAGLDELRSIMVEAHLPAIPTNPEASIKGLAAALQDRYSVAIELDLDEGAIRRAPRLVFDAAQELLRNAAKHSRGSSIRCALSRGDGSLVLDVSDDGVGFGTAETALAVASGHIGLAALAAELEACGGTLDLEYGSEPGSHVRIEMPYPVAAD
jgi:signal transduction histidine kinase